jgi:hypothetical protein
MLSTHVAVKECGSPRWAGRQKLSAGCTNIPRRPEAKNVIVLKRWYLRYLNAKAKRLYKKAKKAEDRAIWLEITLRGKDDV